MQRMLMNTRAVILIVFVSGLLAVALWPKSVMVELATATRGRLSVTVDEEGVTRVRERFVVSSPVTGRVLRIELDPGDVVKRGQPLVRVRAEAAPLLDERARAEARAGAESAKAALGRARAEEQRARAMVTQRQRELTRIRELAASHVVSAQELETQEAELKVSNELLNGAGFAVHAAKSDLERAEARLMPVTANASGRVVTVSSPVSGVVLKRMRESEAIVPAGEPLLEIADPMQLEVAADLLSTDAVRVTRGARALVEQWGGETKLDAVVRRVEPAGFTKISALGVEEQRVNVILEFTDPSSACGTLGDAYRVEVRIVVWEGQDVLKVPTSALFREGDDWAVYRVQGDRVRRTIVDLGHQTGQEAEIIKGLNAGDRIVVHPADTLKDGVHVRAR